MVERYIDENGTRITKGGASWLDGRTTMDDAAAWREQEIGFLTQDRPDGLQSRLNRTFSTSAPDNGGVNGGKQSAIKRALRRLSYGTAFTLAALTANTTTADQNGNTMFDKILAGTEIQMNRACADILSASAHNFQRVACWDNQFTLDAE